MTTTPCLWFDNQGEDAATFYCSVFPNSRILRTTRYGPNTPGREGAAMTVDFELNGQKYVALNGGPEYTFSEAISFYIECADQAEIDYYWNALTEGGEPGPCGWLKDKFGLSWQVAPTRLLDLIGDADAERANRAMQAMMQMGKIILADIEKAADG